MKITYKMTADDFEKAWEYKNKICFGKSKTKQISVLLILTLIISIILSYFGIIYLVVSVAVCCVLIGISVFSRKRNIENIFRNSPIFKSEFSLFVFDEGIRIINNYENMFVPWKSVFSVKETKTHLIIIPTYLKGAYAICKEKNSGEIKEIIGKINENIKIEEAV